MSDDDPRRLAVAQRAKAAPLYAVLVGLGSFWFFLATIVLFNDHFGRISPARQIALFGELPFRDYFDPGYFLTELASAAMQRLLGDNLLGEALLTTTFVAVGTVLVFLLSVRVTRSIPMSLVAAVLALLLLPRAYDYDKVLFYPLGVLLCWRYIERPVAARLWAAAAGLVVAALFRYDTGVYIGAAMVVAIGIVHRGSWRLMVTRAAWLAVAVVCLSAPFLVLIHLYGGGLPDVVDQMVTYGRRETARTQLPPQRFSLPPGSGTWAATADVFLVYLFRALPLVAALLLVYDVRRGDRPTEVTVARIASLITMCTLLNVFILRDPVGARIGGMAGPAAMLAAWVVARLVHSPSGGAHWRRAAMTIAVLLTVASVAASADWEHRFSRAIVRPSHITGVVANLAASPPNIDALPDRALAGAARYLRECTAPSDRVLAMWFAPELYFYARRPFAAGITAVFGEHWSEPRFEERSVQWMVEKPPLVVLARAGDERVRATYPLMFRYFEEHYRNAGDVRFSGDDADAGYTVLVRADRTPTDVHPVTSLPCYR